MIRPSTGLLSPVHRPARPLQPPGKALGGVDVYHDLDDAYAARRVVVDPQVLDVDLRLSCISKQPRQLTRSVGNLHGHRPAPSRGTAVLAGDGLRAAPAPVQQIENIRAAAAELQRSDQTVEVIPN